MMTSCSASTASFVAPADIKQTCYLCKNKGFGGFRGHFQLWLKTFQDLELLTWLLSTTGPTSASSVFGDPQFNKQQIFLWSNFSEKNKTNQQKQQCNKQIAHCVKPKLTLWSKHGSLCALLSTMEEVCNKTWSHKKNKYYPKHPKTCWERVLGMLLGSKYLLRRCLDV